MKLDYNPENDKIINKIEERANGMKLDVSHLTLNQIEKYYPHRFDRIKYFKSFCLVRHPKQRIHSAIYQYYRMYSDLDNLVNLTRKNNRMELYSLLDEISNTLERNQELLWKHSHFNRQGDYIFHKSEQLIENIFDLENKNQLLAWINTNCDFKIYNIPYENKAKHKPGVVMHTLAGGSRIIPRHLKNTLKNFGLSMKNLEKIFECELDVAKFMNQDERVNEFISEIYRSDLEIYESVTKVRKNQNKSFNFSLF